MITIPSADPMMMADNPTPFEPTHPGELLSDELEERHIPFDKFAEQIGMDPLHVKEIMDTRRSVTTQTALLFEAALGIPSHMWLGLQGEYDMWMAKADKKFTRRLAKIRRIAAVL